MRSNRNTAITTFILRRIHKNCCHQSCCLWLKHAPNRLSAGASTQTLLGKLKVLPRPPSQFMRWVGPQKRQEEEEKG